MYFHLQVSIVFANNDALFGSTVLLNDVNLCSWIGLGPVFFDNSGVFRWNFVNLMYIPVVHILHLDQALKVVFIYNCTKYMCPKRYTYEIFLLGPSNIVLY